MNRLRLKQTYYNGSKVFLKCLYSKITGKRIPLFSTLYLTDRCNQRCTHCGIHTVNKKSDLFSTEDWIKIINDLCSLGAEWFRFLGGEPTLRSDLKELIDYCAIKKGKIVEVVTNGVNLEKKMDVIENLQFVGISIEGNKENHERVRGNGSFEKAVNAVKACVDAGKYVRIHMVMNKYNIQKDNVDFMIDFCRRHDIKFDFCRLMINPYYEETSIPEYYYVPDEMAREFYREMLRRKVEEKIPISNSVRSLKLLIDWPFSYDKYTVYKRELGELKDYPLPECTSGIFTFELSSDGKMRLCVNKYDSEIDVQESGGIKRAWGLLGNKECHQCSHLSCIEQSLMLNLDFKALLNTARSLSNLGYRRR